MLFCVSGAISCVQKYNGWGYQFNEFACSSYFDDDHEEVNNSNNEAYQPAPGSPGADKGRDGDSDSDDPLDAFMANIEASFNLFILAYGLRNYENMYFGLIINQIVL
ncbi:hypothetical protein DPMN_063085 [Dreissena polymorpha]|uniref:Uncharacterized protein n=1 Tax=Dreissena polymorpha TaxID=45954 RepID=A0A9D4CAB8_DREPO|nr:hypothetical protein DPMN_063085 [Dreissena polymorpha]